MAPQISRSQRPILCAVLDGTALGPAPERAAARLFAAGVDWIQLRDRELESDALYTLAAALVAAARSADGPHRRLGSDGTSDTDDAEPETGLRDRRRVIVNRRADIALAVGADGVHLGFDAMDAPSARRLLGPEALIGASFHSAREVERAASKAFRSGLSYVHLAPIWDPNSKKATRPALGTQALRQSAIFSLPVLAQGGVDARRAAEAIGAGAAGIAVTGGLSRAENQTTAAGQLRKALDSASFPGFPSGMNLRNQSSPGGDTGAIP